MNLRGLVWLGLALLARPGPALADDASETHAGSDWRSTSLAYGAVGGGLGGAFHPGGDALASGSLALQADALAAASSWCGTSHGRAYLAAVADAHLLGRAATNGPGYSLSAHAAAGGAGVGVLKIGALGGFGEFEATWLGAFPEQYLRFGLAFPLLVQLGTRGHLLLLPEAGLFHSKTGAAGTGPLGGQLETMDAGFTGAFRAAYLSPAWTLQAMAGVDTPGASPARGRGDLGVSVPVRLLPGFTVGGDLRALLYADGSSFTQALLTVGFSGEVKD